MKRNRTWMAIVTCGLMAPAIAASYAWAQHSDPAVEVASGVTGIVATVIGLPVKVASCVATVTLGGVGYGLTAGSSELVRDEMLRGLPYACGAYLYTLPPAIDQVTEEREWSR
jgi:hypothetical protein